MEQNMKGMDRFQKYRAKLLKSQTSIVNILPGYIQEFNIHPVSKTDDRQESGLQTCDLSIIEKLMHVCVPMY